jgi:C_GCAxxG_C_C family probable redox protein
MKSLEKHELADKAAERFLEGYNCAQSVLLTMCEYWNVRSKLVPMIASGFGGGIGRCGSVCGVLTGGVMALGIKLGSNDALAEKRRQVYDMSGRFVKQFEKRHGTIYCRDLIGYDLFDPKEWERAKREKVVEKTCVHFAREAVEALLDLTEASRGRG